jgi:hypothetical protein
LLVATTEFTAGSSAVIASVAASGTAAPGRLPWVVPIVFAGLAVLGACEDWGYRQGWRMFQRSVGPGRPRRGLKAVLSYVTRPAMIVGAASTLASAPLTFYDNHHRPPAIVWAVILTGLFAVLCALIWSWKEFERPTLSRTPAWLWDLMAEDEEIRDRVCGKRALPPRPK